MKLLRVGDTHVTVSNLINSQKLLNFVLSIAIKEKVRRVEFMGDLFDTHGVIRLEVLDFWIRNIKAFKDAGIEVLIIAGNHDLLGDKQRERTVSAIDVLSLVGAIVINKPAVYDGIAYVPYYSEEADFVKAAADLLPLSTTKTLVCHQTFDGSKWDNGMFAPQGFNPELLKEYQIVSGHIHTEQKFANVFYLGTPKWEGIVDANEDKGVWMFEDGKPPLKISTENICSKVIKIDLKEGDEIPVIEKNENKVFFVLTGSSSWVSKTAKDLAGLGSISRRITDAKNKAKDITAKTSSLSSYASHFKFDKDVEPKDVLELIECL
jgi:DNA repair exonuclease SbcCD nuclease subunit